MGFPKQKDKLGEKAKRVHAGIPLLKEDIKMLIGKYKGNLSRIADAMGTTRTCVRNNINRDEELKQLLEDARERLIDDVEQSAIEQAAESNDVTLKIFLLKTRGKDRGYSQDDIKDAVREVTKSALDFVMNRSKNIAQQ